MEAADFFETSVTTQETILQYYNPEDHNINIHPCKNFKTLHKTCIQLVQITPEREACKENYELEFQSKNCGDTNSDI
jgi:hypothetical protein